MTISRRLEVSLLPEDFAIGRLPAGSAVPEWAMKGSFFSVTRTPEEVSVVCSRQFVPEELRDEIRWRAFKVHGPFAFSEIGVLAALAGPLAEAKVGIFVISTFDTDYLLVNSAQLRGAREALERAGHTVHEAETAS